MENNLEEFFSFQNEFYKNRIFYEVYKNRCPYSRGGEIGAGDLYHLGEESFFKNHLLIIQHVCQKSTDFFNQLFFRHIKKLKEIYLNNFWKIIPFSTIILPFLLFN